ncbi:hypothetical protein [Streptomyces virginiae]|uniref:hypothetical protein n=1 Tax=Streptomyces virginiae TaxID=1961 RepID=UPI00324ED1D0
MTAQPYAVRLSTPVSKVLDTLREHAEDIVRDVLDAAAADPSGFGRWNGPTVLNIVRLGQLHRPRSAP